MVSLVEQMLGLNKQVHTEGVSSQEKNILRKQIEITDKQIEGLIYNLYYLTEDEIAIVEGDW